MNSCEELDLLAFFQKVLPDLKLNQNQLDNPSNDISLFYQAFRNKLYSILSDALKEIEPDEGKRADADTVYSLVRFINYTTQYVYPNVDTSMTFKLLVFPKGKSFKVHARSLLRVLWKFELEFTKIRDALLKRTADSKTLQAKRAQLDNLKKQLASKILTMSTDENSYKELQKKHEKVQARFRKLTQQQDTERQVSDNLKEDVKLVVQKHDNLQVLVTNIKMNIKHLNKQIVTEDSYRALLSLKESVNLMCTELTNEEGSIQENLRGKNLDIGWLNSIEVQVNEFNVLAKQLITTHQYYTVKNSDCKQIYKTIQEHEHKIKELNHSRVQLQNQISALKDVRETANHKNSESEEAFSQGLVDIKAALCNEKKIQEQQIDSKRSLEKVLLNLNKSYVVVKNQIDDINNFQKHLYQKIINSENTNTENLSNALTKLYDLLKPEQ